MVMASGEVVGAPVESRTEATPEERHGLEYTLRDTGSREYPSEIAKELFVYGATLPPPAQSM